MALPEEKQTSRSSQGGFKPNMTPSYPPFQKGPGIRWTSGDVFNNKDFVIMHNLSYPNEQYKMNILGTFGDNIFKNDTIITKNGKEIGSNRAMSKEQHQRKYNWEDKNLNKTNNFDKYKQMFIKSFNNPNNKNKLYYENTEDIEIKQQGGTMNQQQGIEQQVVQLVQAAAAGDQKATQQIEKIMQAAQQGNQEAIQIAQIIQKVVQAMQAQQGVKAQLGAKLAYINKLKGICPEGSEKVYLKNGGCMCKQKAAEGAELKKKKQPKNEVQKFKAAKGCKTSRKKKN